MTTDVNNQTLSKEKQFYTKTALPFYAHANTCGISMSIERQSSFGRILLAIIRRILLAMLMKNKRR